MLMLHAIVLLVALRCSVIYANIIILSRHVAGNETTLAFEDEITGPFITVGDEDDNEFYQNSNSTLIEIDADEDAMNGETIDPNHPDESEEFDDYDFTLGHLHALSTNAENASELGPSNFHKRRRKNPNRGNGPKFPNRHNSNPNNRVKRPNQNPKRKRIRIKNDSGITPNDVTQIVNSLNRNCVECQCGIGQGNHINSNMPARQLEFPWLVHLSYFGRFYCSGSLINDRYVLTAGHCTRGFVTRMIQVRLLEQEFETSYVVRSVEEVYRPPTYNYHTLEDDIALLKISPPVSLGRITPICLPIRGSSYAGRNAIVAGWDINLERAANLNDGFRKAFVPILSNQECRKNSGSQEITRRMLCAGSVQANKADVCQILSNITVSTPFPPNLQSIQLNSTHELGLLLDDQAYRLLLPEEMLQNASYLDAITDKNFNETTFAINDKDENVKYEYGDENEENEENEDYDEEEETVDKVNALQSTRKQCPKCHCGIRNIRRIVGGKVTTKYRYPWAVILRYGDRFYCGGTLVSDLHVVTAGHCTEGLSVRKISVGFLQHDLRNPQRGVAFNRKIKSYRRHKKYNSRSLANDIAILTLSKRVPIGTSLLRTVCIPQPKTDFNGKEAVVAGWGTVGEYSPPSSKLRQAVVPVISNKRCRQTGYGNEIKSSMLCAGYPRKGGVDACQGDSGGPLMVPRNKRFHLAGITSWGDGCAKRNHPGVYTRVTKYIQWIRNRTKNGCFCS